MKRSTAEYAEERRVAGASSSGSLGHVRSVPEQDAPATTPPCASASSAVDQSAPATIYDAVLPVIVAALDKPVSAEDLAKRLDVAKGQLQKWLKQAVTDKKIKKLTKPVRYVRK